MVVEVADGTQDDTAGDDEGWVSTPVDEASSSAGGYYGTEPGAIRVVATTGRAAPMTTSGAIEEPYDHEASEASGSEHDAKQSVPAQDTTPKAAAMRVDARAGDGVSLRKIRNQTPNRLLIVNSQNEVAVLAPLEEREFDVDRWPTDAMEEMELVSNRVEKNSSVLDVIAQLIGGAFAAGIFGLAIIQAIAEENPDYKVQIWTGSVAFLALALGVIAVFLFKQQAPASRMLAQGLTLLLVLAISVFVPVAVVLKFADENMSTLNGVDVFVRVTQIAIISVAAMLPGLLFFFFDRQKLSTLRNRFERQIFRLDPNVLSLADVYARYGRQLEETYGSADSRQGNRLARQRRWPILLATLVLTLGWIIAMAPVGVLPARLNIDDIPEVLAPRPHPVVFGFLGSYFYALNLIWRRYTRGDLRPKAYSAITVRILVVLVVTWVLAATTDANSDAILVASFLIGIVPETAFVLWRETVAGGLSLLPSFKALEERQPLQDLEGVDLYDRARLLEEGISNVQALAHHELVDLLLETRIPAGRLVDWVDQAILYLHCNCPSAADQHGGDKLRERLKDVGIRTATDFEMAMSEPTSQEALLAVNGKNDDGFEKSVLMILLMSLRDDEWMSYVRRWRQDQPVSDVKVVLSQDGSTISIMPSALTNSIAHDELSHD